MAVAAALAAAAGPYLGRTLRRWSWALVGLVAVACLYVDAGLPLDVVAALVLGWTIVSAVHLMFGAREKAIPLAEVREALGRLGVDVARMQMFDLEIRGGIPYLATTGGGDTLALRIAGREQRDLDLLYKLYR